LISKSIAARRGRPSDRDRKVGYDARVSAIVQQRERRMAEIRSLDRQGLAPGSFVHKAQRLLTLGWSRASWRSRAGIIRTVDWLLEMERVHRSGLKEGGNEPAGLVDGGIRCE
jgi:hypothetical protein